MARKPPSRARQGEEPFLAAIAASRDDDAPRLRYADWLSQGGDPLGGFICRQCRRGRPLLPPRFSSSDLDHVEQALLDAHGETWLRPLRQLGVEDYLEYLDAVVFQSGMVEKVRLADEDTVLRHADALFEAAPALRGIILWKQVSYDRLAAAPALARLTELQLVDHISYAELRQLLASSHLSNLRTLALPFEIGPRGAALLASCRQLSRLTTLALHGELGDKGAKALANSPHLAQLAHLELIGCGIGPAGVRALTTSPRLPELHRLSLRSSPIGTDGVRALAERPEPWTELDLVACGVSAAAAARLARAPCAAGLMTLNLHNNDSDEGARALAASPRLAGPDHPQPR
jgi:uncharacterized protein (TIGR02996 family)